MIRNTIRELSMPMYNMIMDMGMLICSSVVVVVLIISLSVLLHLTKKYKAVHN